MSTEESWRDAYESLIKKARTRFVSMACNTAGWLEIERPESRFKLFEYAAAPCTLMCKGVLNARAERVHYVMTDTDYERRSQWDAKELQHIERLEAFTCSNDATINIVHYWSKSMGMWDRYFLGAQQSTYDATTKSHLSIFESARHRHFACPEDKVEAYALLGSLVRAIDKKTCEVTIISEVDPKGWIPQQALSMFKERVRAQMHVIERVAGQEGWNKYYKPSKLTSPRRPPTKEEK